jgi:nucleoside-diphosphate-sugar epimerase
VRGLAVVLGGSGGIGGAVVAELQRNGRAVRSVDRHGGASADGVERLPADLTDPFALRHALADASVVYFCAQPPYDRWVQDFVPMTRAVLNATAEVAAVLVMADNLYMYGPTDGLLTERTPMRPTSRKGRVRAELAELLGDAHRSSRVRTVQGRASDYFGPGGIATTNGTRTFGAAVAGKRASWLGSLDVPHTMSYLPDIARGLVTLAEHEEAWGRPWHIPAITTTARDFLTRLFAELGQPPRMAATGPLVLALAGLVDTQAREIRELLYQFDRPFVSDGSAFQAAFGPYQPTPLNEAIATTVAWWRARAAGTDPG